MSVAEQNLAFYVDEGICPVVLEHVLACLLAP